MNKLDKIKEIVDKYYSSAPLGIFDNENLIGDPMFTVYASDGVVVDICYVYEYFEVKGLEKEEFKEIEAYYNAKRA